MTIGTNFSIVDDSDVLAFERLAMTRNYSIVDVTSGAGPTPATSDEFLRGFAAGSLFGAGDADSDDAYQSGFNDGALSVFLTVVSSSSSSQVVSPTLPLGGIMLMYDDYQSGYDEGVKTAELLIAAQNSAAFVPVPPVISEIRVVLDDNDDYQNGYDDSAASSFLANSLPSVTSTPIVPEIRVVLDDNDDYQNGYDDSAASSFLANSLPSVTSSSVVSEIRVVLDDDDNYQNGYDDGVTSAFLVNATSSVTTSSVTEIRVVLDDDNYQSGYDDGIASAFLAKALPSVISTPTITTEFRIVLDDNDDYQNGYDDSTASSFLANSLAPVVIPPPLPPIILIPSTSRRSLQRGTMAVTPRFRWPIPARNIDEWYDSFLGLQVAVDTSTFANTDDRNAICMGGGTFGYTQSSGLLTWDDTIEVLSANTGFVRSVESSEIVLNDGELFLIELQRFPSENSIAPPLKASNLSTLENINDTFVLAIRRNNIVYFRNGKNMQDGDSFKVFATVGNGGGGSVFTTLPVSGNGTIGSPITIGSNAIVNAKLATMNSHTLKGNATGVSATPVDLTATQAKGLLAITAGDVSGLAAVATTGSASSLSGLATVATTGNASDLSGLAAIATSGSASNLITGLVPVGRMPAFFGDIKTINSSVSATIEPNAVTNAKLATMPTLTIKGNNTGSTVNALDLTVLQVQTMLGVGVSTPFYFGTSSDGAVVLDGISTVLGMVPISNVYTGLRTYFFSTLTINSGVIFKPDGFEYYIGVALAGTGIIDTSGTPGTIGSFGNPPWTASRPLPTGASGGLAGLAAAGAASQAIRYADNTPAAGGATGANIGTAGGVLHGGGGGGGVGGPGAVGGDVIYAAATAGDWEVIENATEGCSTSVTGGAFFRTVYSVGSGGGGGGSNGSTGAGGGGTGGYQVGFVKSFTGTVTIRSNGGDGAAGGLNGSFPGGGGGGGSGGIVVLVCGPGTTPPTPQVAGGIGGAGAGGSSANGGDGGTGKFIIFQ